METVYCKNSSSQLVLVPVTAYHGLTLKTWCVWIAMEVQYANLLLFYSFSFMSGLYVIILSLFRHILVQTVVSLINYTLWVSCL